MAQKNRSKDIWLIPKRVNLHQTVCLIDGIIKRGYANSVWNEQKQNNLGVNLKKWGATNDGKNISNQSIRTLVASVPQYLGFVFINYETSPSTLILTPAGKRLWENHRKELVAIKNLRKDADKTIKISKDLLKQMEKLQITNPVILKDCNNIYLFPFRFLLRLLDKIKYIDLEEIAYFLFRSYSDDQVDTVALEIQQFRKYSVEDRAKLIDAFRKTHVGNITLVKAPSARYFISLCLMTGIIENYQLKPNTSNSNKKISAIRIKSAYEEYVKDTIQKFTDVPVFDFENNLNLWIEYMGEPARETPPISLKFINKNNFELFWSVEKNGLMIDSNIVSEHGEFNVPVFMHEGYKIKIFRVSNGDLLFEDVFAIDDKSNHFEIPNITTSKIPNFGTVKSYSDEIMNHINEKNFSTSILEKLKTIAKITGIDKTEDKHLRGAYLEYYFFMLLKCLESKGIIDEVIWNGKLGKYGLPNAAPGGKTGTPDIVFKINDIDFILELTTIKAKSTQFRAEGASVPDHIKLYEKTTSRRVHGIFCAPIIHSRNNSAMESVLKGTNTSITFFEVTQLLEILKEENRIMIYKKLLGK